LDFAGTTTFGQRSGYTIVKWIYEAKILVHSLDANIRIILAPSFEWSNESFEAVDVEFE
jgi:hypothetical protein